MRRLLSVVLGVGVGVVCFTVLQVIQSRNDGLAVNPPEVVVNGSPNQAGMVTASFQLTNRGWGSMDLDVRLNCSCGKVTPSRLMLGSGETRTVEVEVSAPASGKRFRYTLNCLDAASKQLLAQAALNGGAFPRVTTPVQAIQMAVLGEEGVSERVIEVSNPSQTRYAGRLAVEGLASPYVRVSPESVILEPGATVPVHVEARHPGHRRVRGEVRFLDDKSKEVHAVEVVLTGESRYAANPPGIVWSEDVPPASPVVVELARADGVEFAIESARLEPEVPWLSVDTDQPPGAAHRIRLNLSPDAQGRSYTGVLRIATDRTDEAHAPPIHVVAARLSTGPGPTALE